MRDSFPSRNPRDVGTPRTMGSAALALRAGAQIRRIEIRIPTNILFFIVSLLQLCFPVVLREITRKRLNVGSIPPDDAS